MWQQKVLKKQDELLETPMLEEAKARTKLDKQLNKVCCLCVVFWHLPIQQPAELCGTRLRRVQ